MPSTKFVKVSLSSNRILLLLALGACGITLYFSVRLGIDSFRYFSLNGTAKAFVSQWEIVQIKDCFALKATYQFEAEKTTWRNVFTLTPPYYLNEYSALEALKEKAKKNWIVSYDVGQPTRSALEREFPFGLLFRSLVCFGVLFYLLYLYKRMVFV